MRQNHFIFCSLSETTTVSYQCWRLAEQIERKKSDSTMHNVVVVNDWKIKIIPNFHVQHISKLFKCWLINRISLSNSIQVLIIWIRYSFCLNRWYVHMSITQNFPKVNFKSTFFCIAQGTTIKTLEINAIQHLIWRIKV